jgi:nitrogen fixation NifU-like protein
MSDLRDLYQEVILDHHKKPRNYGSLESPDRVSDGHNPLCGDRLHLCVDLDDQGRIADIRFEGSGCAISTASASMMTESVKGKPIAEVDALYHKMHAMLTGEGEADGDGPPLGKLEVFAGVHEYPARVKCASLAWHTLEAALHRSDETVTTE